VLVEALSNNLKVRSVVATSVIDQAIKTTHPQVTSTQLTSRVRITQGMLDQAEASLAAVQVLDSSGPVKSIVTEVSAIAANSLPGDIVKVLPADASDVLENSVTLSLSADKTQITTINKAVASGVYTQTSSTTSPIEPTVSEPASSGSTAPANSAPVISGKPAASVTANNYYTFQPTASDADGDTLSFSVTNKPVWASFSTKTGRLSGTPGNGDAGTFSNIVISASDGKAVASLRAFSIRVDAAVVETGVTIGWTAPSKRADGTPLSLSDINGYHIYYGASSGNYPNVVDVADGSTTTTTISGIAPGTYYLVMTTYDVNGRESGFSAQSTILAR
jgi:hypothetical protein